MKRLLESIEELKKSKVKDLVDARIKEFKEVGKKSDEKIFDELCFCILTANFNAKRSIEIQNKMGNGFSNFPESLLTKKLKDGGHRFPEARAKYIIDARKCKDSIKNIMELFNDENELRDWIARNVKGIGYKEASHFLRNIGYDNLAIIDFHIINLLTKYGLIERPKTLTIKKYLEIEDLLRKVARKSNLSLAELDLYLWYIETGKILK